MPSPAGLDAMEVDALQTDRYLEALLSAIERRADDVPAATAIDPTLRVAARRLRDELVRTHPSFRFEERLARRLAEAAARMRLATAAGSEAEAAIIPFPPSFFADPALVAELANPELARLVGVGSSVAVGGTPAVDAAGATLPGPVRRAASEPAAGPPRPVVARPLLVGGALTSAAISLAGAAFVAWRLTRGAPADPMSRAVRAARAARAASGATPAGPLAIRSAPRAERRPLRLA